MYSKIGKDKKLYTQPQNSNSPLLSGAATKEKLKKQNCVNFKNKNKNKLYTLRGWSWNLESDTNRALNFKKQKQKPTIMKIPN